MGTVTFEISGRNIIVMDGPDGHVFPVEAIASWGTLLGLTDTAQIITAILSQRDGEQPDWAILYDKLGAALEPMAAAGVPAEIMPVLLDPTLGAPVPGPELLADLQAAQSTVAATVVDRPSQVSDPGIATEIAAAIESDDTIDMAAVSAAVFDALSPTYTLADKA